MKTGVLLYIVWLSPFWVVAQQTDSSIITVDSTDKETIFRQAGDYSAEYDVLTIAVLRGTYQKELYDQYLDFLKQRLDSLDIPYQFFQEFHNNEGTGFYYFIENDFNGPIEANSFNAMLPHIQSRFEVEYR